MFCSLSNNSASLSDQEAAYYTTTTHDFATGLKNNNPTLICPKMKKKRNLPGNPDPEAEVIALSPTTLMTTNRFICEICNKGFQRDQNLQLHRRGHNLPWKLKQRSSKDIKKRVYVCPEVSCVHHHPSRALGDLTGIKKHFCRKHGEKKWKCEKCTKVYAVQSDWKAHFKGCGTREYRCDCGTIFSRKDSFVTHRAFCDALAQESARLSSTLFPFTTSQPHHFQSPPTHISPSATWNPTHATKLTQPRMKNEAPPFFQNSTTAMITSPFSLRNVHGHNLLESVTSAISSPHLSATALLQKASTLGATTSVSLDHHLNGFAPEYMPGFGSMGMVWQKNDNGLTRDFLGLNGECNVVRDQILTYADSVGFAACHDSDAHAMLKPRVEARFTFPNPPASENWVDR